ncbi:hypothetical protein ACVWZL_008593 [Bradyrhizobium sp. GM2.4]
MESIAPSAVTVRPREALTPRSKPEQLDWYRPVPQLSQPDVAPGQGNLNASVHSHRKNDLTRNEDVLGAENPRA